MRSLVIQIFALCLSGAVLAQTSADPNEGSLLTLDPTPDGYDFSWWGRAGRTYFIQHSEDLFTWQYVPLIESGADEVLSWGFSSTADRFFLRLKFADIPTSDPSAADFDGDKVSNWDEINNQTNPLHFADTDGDGLPDDWERFYGLALNNPADAGQISQGGELTNLEKYEQGLDPTRADTDGDNATDGTDQYPLDERRSEDIPALGHALIDLGAGVMADSQKMDRIALGQDGRVAFSWWEGNSYKVAKWKDGQLAEGSPKVTATQIKYYNFQTGDYHDPVPITGTSWMRDFLSADGDVVRWSPAVDISVEHYNSDATAFWPYGTTIARDLWYGSTPPQPDGTNGWSAQQFLDNGNVIGLAWNLGLMPGVGILSAATQGVSYIYQDTGSDYSWYDGVAISPNGVAGFTCIAPQTAAQVLVVNPQGQATTIRSEQGSASPTVGNISAINDAQEFVLQDSDLGKFIYYTGATARGKLEELLPEKYREQIRYDDSAIFALTNSGKLLFAMETLEGPGRGQWVKRYFLSDKIPDSTTYQRTLQIAHFPDGWKITPSQLLNSGLLSAAATKTVDAAGNPIPEANQVKRPGLLLPVDFVTKDKDYEEVPTTVAAVTTQGPTVELDELAVANVVVVGGEGRVTIRGTIRDAIADNVPQGQGADIAFADIYVNGEKVDEELTLTRADDGEPDAWRRHPVKWTFERQVTFPADATTTITVESGPNAAERTGSDAVQVHFARTHTGFINVPAQTHDYEIEISASFSPTVVDTVTLREPGQPGTGQILQESGPATNIFQRSDGLSLAFTGAYQATGEIDTIHCKIVPLSGAGGLGYSSSVSCVESGQTTNVFRYTENVPGYGYGDTYSHTVSDVTNVEAETVADRPLKLRVGIPEEWADIFTVELAGQTLKAKFTDDTTGFRYASTHAEEPWIAHVIADPADAEVLNLIYWDKTANILRQVPLDDLDEDLKAKLALNDNEIAKVPLKATRLRWVNSDGEDIDGLHKLTVEALTGFIAGDPDMEIDEDHFAYIEVTGMTDDRRLRVTSSDFPTDKFDLVIGDTPASGRFAQLEEIAGGHYRTTEKVVVYQSSPDTDTLTDAQWNALKEMGYLAVHNEEPDAKDLLKGVVLNQSKPPVFQDHHLFNQFAPSTTAPRYKGFFKKVFGNDFDIHLYTVPVERIRHGEISSAITTRWKSLIDQVTGANGNLLISQTAARRRALDEMFAIANDFDLDLSKTRVYRTRVNKGLSTVDELLKLDSFDGKIDLSAGNAKATRWKALTKKGTKRLGKSFLKGLPILSHALTAWAVVALVADPAGAIAAELDISRETAEALIAGEVYVTSTLWNTLPEVDEAVLSDGTAVYKGKAAWIADIGMSADGSFRITRVTWYEISSIVPTAEVGVVNIRCIRRGTTNEGVAFDGVRGSSDVCPAEGDVWNP